MGYRWTRRQNKLMDVSGDMLRIVHGYWYYKGLDNKINTFPEAITCYPYLSWYTQGGRIRENSHLNPHVSEAKLVSLIIFIMFSKPYWQRDTEGFDSPLPLRYHIQMAIIRLLLLSNGRITVF